MMNYFNGFDALNDKEYNDLMEEMEMNNLQDELAAKNATDYFENELEKDGQTHSLFDILDITTCDEILEDLALADSENIWSR